MAKMTIGFGLVLVVLGLMAFHFGGHGHSAMLGVVLIVCGMFANTENPKQRMIWMHIAVTLGLIGFLFPGITGVIALCHGKTTAEVYLRLVASAVCAVYTGLCVRSFIDARRTRVA